MVWTQACVVLDIVCRNYPRRPRLMPGRLPSARLSERQGAPEETGWRSTVENSRRARALEQPSPKMTRTRNDYYKWLRQGSWQWLWSLWPAAMGGIYSCRASCRLACSSTLLPQVHHMQIRHPQGRQLALRSCGVSTMQSARNWLSSPSTSTMLCCAVDGHLSRPRRRRASSADAGRNPRPLRVRTRR